MAKAYTPHHGVSHGATINGRNTWLAHLAEIKTSHPWEDQHSFSIYWVSAVSNERCDLTLAIVGLGYA